MQIEGRTQIIGLETVSLRWVDVYRTVASIKNIERDKDELSCGEEN